MAQEKQTSKSLLYSCLIVTVVLHLAFVTYLFRNPLFFQPSFATAWTKGMHVDATHLSKTEASKSLFLQEALSQMVLIPSKEKPQQEALADVLNTPNMQQEPPASLVASSIIGERQGRLEVEEGFSSSASIDFPLVPESVVSTDTSLFHPAPSLAPESLISSVSLPSPPLQIDYTSPSPDAYTPCKAKEASLEPTAPLYKERVSDGILYLPTGYEERRASIFFQKREREACPELIAMNPSVPLMEDNPACTGDALLGALAAIEEYLPDEPGLCFSDWSDYFHLDTIFLPHEEGEEYRFAFTLTPKDDLSSIQMRQNIHFLIDRSNSIEKHRFTGYKRAVLRTLSSLTPDQTFNICVFDRKSILLSKEPIQATQKNLLLAKQFLEAQEPGGAFAAGELYNTLTKLIPDKTSTQEMHIAILLSDGNSSLSNKKQQEALGLFLKKNHHQLSLYAATCGPGNDLTLLKVITTQAGGDLLFSPTHAAFARKLAKFVHSLRAPLAKEISTTLTVSEKRIKAKLLTPSEHLPALFNHHPYTLYGALSEPTTLTLTIEGIHKNQPIVIQKEIPFERPLQKSPQLEKEWLQQLSLNQWGKYIKTGKKENLVQAKAFEEKAAAVKLRRIQS